MRTTNVHNRMVDNTLLPPSKILPVQCFEWQNENEENNDKIPHYHQYDEILFFRKGNGIHQIGHHSYQIQDNSIHLIKKNQIHALHSESKNIGGHLIFNQDQLIKKLHLSFQKLFLNSEMNEQILNLSAAEFEESISIFEQIKQCHFQSPEIYSREYTLVYFNLLLLKLSEFSSKKSSPSGISKNKDPLAIRFQQLVNQNFIHERRVEEYAKKLHICPKYLCEICKKNFGFSPSQLINKQLLQKSKSLLIDTNWPIKQIAFEMQFNDQAYFSRYFKKMTGSSPVHYRKKIKN